MQEVAPLVLIQHDARRRPPRGVDPDRFMQRRVEGPPDARKAFHAVARQDVDGLTGDQANTLGEGLLRVPHIAERAVPGVEHGQEVAKELLDAEATCLFDLALGALAVVVEVSAESQELVSELVVRA